MYVVSFSFGIMVGVLGMYLHIESGTINQE